MKHSSIDEYNGYIVTAGQGPVPRLTSPAVPPGLVANDNAPVSLKPVPLLIAPPVVAPAVPKGFYRSAGKRALDILLVIASLPVSVPIILFSALLLWLEGGKPFYRQTRLGRNGREFDIIKLRTMNCDAEQCLQRILDEDPQKRSEWEATQKLKRDPRVTRIGAILRSTSMDELPQILNVLKGEMALVGPRPMFADQLALYGEQAAGRAYFPVRPGITGAWQVSARNYENFVRRAELDADYVKSYSLVTDLKILARTVGVVLRRTGY